MGVEENINVVSENPTVNQESVESSQTKDENIAETAEITVSTEQTDAVEPVETPPAEIETKVEEVQNDTAEQSKEDNALFKSMRIRAEKEAEAKFKKQVDDMKAKIKIVLPDDFTDVDEFLASIEDDSDEDVEETVEEEIEEEVEIPKKTPTPSEPPKQPALDETKLDEIVAKKLEAIPEFQEIKKQKEKEKEDAFIIASFEEVKSKFSDIKTANDVPAGAWDLWRLGKSGRTLISCVKESRYDNDIEKAKQKGAANVKGQMNSVAHTGIVNGNNGQPIKVEDEVHVPPETQTMLARAGVPKNKWADYYKKYHR